ncbi:hypothetical protein Tco_1165972 [Tanacetum coccineum]
MIESEKPLKKKEQIRLDAELALKLQAEEEEHDRLAREKSQQVEEANISWDNVQAMMEVDRLLSERLQAREQEELTDEEKVRLFVELLEKRKKHFAALRAQEKKNKPPTKAQKKSTMLTYLKHMADYRQKAMDSQTTQTIKLPILQPGEYDLWKMRMEQYLQCIDYTLWEVIENGNAPVVTKIIDGKETGIPPTSVEEKVQRRA